MKLIEKGRTTRCILLCLILICTAQKPSTFRVKSDLLDNPLLFALVVPPLTYNNFGHQLETFGNHLTGMPQRAPRGGDLCMMNVDGTIRFLTEEAGFGVTSGEIQSENGIAVRQPCVHWDGDRALFSMVIGGPIKAYDQSYRSNKWQMYEITNLADVVSGAAPIIEKIPNQPDYNNISPIYGSDDQIIFTSDAPLFDLAHTYPQMDEYESSPTNTGIFKLDPSTGKTIHLTHSPSGDFDIHLAKDGRIISTRWEHLKRDQQASNHRAGNTQWQPVNYESESADASIVKAEATKDGKPYADADGTPYEIFPEAFVHIENGINVEPNRDPNEPLHDFNEFLPWEITENGERHQTVNHVGRHEFGGVFQHGSKMDDDNLVYNLGNLSANAYRETVGSDAGIFQIKEDPRPGKEGTFYGVWAREFGRFSSGRVFEFALPIGANPQDMEIIDWTNEDIDNRENDLGHFRNPMMLMNGTMLASYATQSNLFGRDNAYTFRISKMVKKTADNSDTEHIAGAPLSGAVIEREIVYWGDAVTPISITVEMSEAEIVEIVPRTRPTARPKYEIDPIEKSVLDEEEIDEEALRTWMIEKNLALIAIRNMTERDAGEQQQPFNLRVPGGVESIPASGKVYDISHFQIFGGEMIRGYGLREYVGRRTIATPLRNTEANPDIEGVNLFDTSGPESSVKIASDGSVAAFVPATRALTWQSVAPDGESIVRERQWITFAPGEIRTCEGCHGINDKSHLGNSAPQNKPEALRALMKSWKNGNGGTSVLGIESTYQVQNGVTFYQSFPNPFRNATTISFSLEKQEQVNITIYDMQGKIRKRLLSETRDKGKHSVLWTGKNKDGGKCSPGIYIIEFSAGEVQMYNRIIIQ
ncbi:MAG: T9SS type A sorting domain-containing protein [Cyclobacteriaceae bacterium]